MQLKLSTLLILGGFFASSRLEAVAILGPPSSSGIGLGLSSLYRQQPDLLREQRYRIDFFWLKLLANCRSLCLQWENHLGLAPDLQSRSKSVEVHDNVYQLFSGLRLSYAYLLRYGFSAGPLLDLQETYTQLKIGQQQREIFRRWAWGWQGQFAINYALNSRWEVLGFLSYQTRPKAEKSDVAFGLALVLNTQPALPSAPPVLPVRKLGTEARPALPVGP